MRRNGYIVVLLALAAWIVVAIVLGADGPTGARAVVPPSGPSPTCLPSSLEHSATLTGTSLDVSPAPGTGTANPATQVSFRGIDASSLSNVWVQGSSSGYHRGHLAGYFQGDGASFVPDRPFAPGELVSVRALLGPAGSGRRISFAFHVATPYPTGGIPGFPDPPASASATQSFVSAPELHPPVLSVTSPDRDPKAGLLMMTTGPGPGQYGPLIFTPQGRLVWFGALPRGLVALNLSVQRYEGQADLSFWQGKVVGLGFGQGEDVVMDSSYQTVATVRAGNGLQADLHDFQIQPGGVAYLTAYNVMRCDLSTVGGVRNGVVIDTVIQQVDMKTGLVRWEWHSLDHVAASDSHAPVPTTAIPWDTFHLNSIDIEPGGRLLISARSTWAAYELNPASGGILWRLGGTGSSFTMGKGTEVAWQHDARLQPDGTITMFDDGSNPRVHYQSRGVRIVLDRRRHTASLAAVYPHPGSPLVSDSQGNMQTLPDANLLIGWGAIPSLTELATDGRMLLDAQLPAGYSSYRAFRFPWSGRPLAPPLASARVLATGDQTAVFASWNGASEVVSWRVLAGPSSAALTPQATMPASGFESSTTFPDADASHPYPYVAVQAIGPGGAVLATSAAVRVTGT